MIAVIGSGISGAVCARELHKAGREVVVFDKGRGPGGRASTRRAPTGSGFDHGAQYFTAKSEAFRRQVGDWTTRGIAAPWEGRFVDLANGQANPKASGSHTRFVGTPTMSAIVGDLASEGEFRYGVRVGSVDGEPGAWELTGAAGEGLGVFEAVVVSAPAPQTAELLAQAAPAIAAQAAGVQMSGCWAVLTAFNEGLGLPFDGAYVTNSALSWAARNSSKPGRELEPETWTLHASPEWSEEHLEDDPMEVVRTLLSAFWEAAGHRQRSRRARHGRTVGASLCRPSRWPITACSTLIGALGPAATGALVRAWKGPGSAARPWPSVCRPDPLPGTV